jgi:hypothetical protein
MSQDIGGDTFDIRKWALPDPDAMPQKRRDEYIRRRDAQIAVLEGTTLRQAARLHQVNRQTLAEIGIKFFQTAPDGKPWGFRACVPYAARKEPSAAAGVRPPPKKGPQAFAKILAATPDARTLVEAYRGALPNGERRNTKFDGLHAKVIAAIRKAHGDAVYPFDTSDRGRRAMLEFIRRLREQRAAANAPALEAATPEVTKLRQLFQLKPLDRIEYDGHTIDVDWRIEVPTPDGTTILRSIKQVTLLAAICAVSRYLLGYVLTFGAYNQLDVLGLFHDILLPWKPRPLVVPNMAYAPGAVLGLPAACDGRLLRGSLLAKDNAFAQHAAAVRKNLLLHHRGVLNFGPAYVPEIRGMIEAFFKRIEMGALRFLPGAFQPESGDIPRTATTLLRAEDFPVHQEAFADLMDVIAAGHNVTPHSGLHEKLPVEVLRAHLASGGWMYETADAEQDARRLLTLRFHPTVRGSTSPNGKLPYVQWNHGIYRSPQLDTARSKVGHVQTADVYLRDVRDMVLLGKDGTVWSRLQVLPPWNQTAHSLDIRLRAHAARNRTPIRIAGAQDAVVAYYNFVQEQAATGRGNAEAYARIAPAQGSPPSSPRPKPTPTRPLSPRSGDFTFEGKKD